MPRPVARIGRASIPTDAPRDPPAWEPLLPRLPVVLVAIGVVLAALSIGLPNVAPDVPWMAAEGSPVRMFFGVSQEMNLPTFFSVMLITAAGASHLLIAGLTGGRTGAAFVVTGVLLIVMAFDDFVALHERLNGIGALVAPDGFSGAGYLWVLPASVVAAVVVLAFVRLVMRLEGQARLSLLLGIGLVLLAAMGLETMNGFLDHPGTDGAPLQLGTHLEELVENLGMILVLRGALLLLRIRRVPGELRLRVDGAAVGSPAVPPA